MGVSDEWRDAKYAEVFEQETVGLKRRLEADPSCTKESLQGLLDNLYIMDGADWGGRGELQDTIMSATIAAYEHFIAGMKP